ncbi:DUF2064 domain-containing protein [Hymenobacter antarcticus]|uniref:DUF2064 domain-containing protein n=1 Tax=Hymenobacter antarcticus TaxID=486270 RepID=A0ABP7R2B1_9BACT
MLFTRSAGGEAVHKRFVPHGTLAANAAVAAQLIARATEVAQQAGADFLCVESAQQVGRTFGERLTAAITHSFGLGYEQLIVIGNDCPQLSPGRLRQALHLLASADAVLGPATDGGVYLLGIKRAFFDAQAWRGLPWQTGKLGPALARCLRAARARLHILRPLADVDTAQDLAGTIAQLPAGQLRTRLRRLRATPPVLALGHPALRLATPALHLPQRAPPSH